MKVLITGSTGFIGKRLVSVLTEAGHTVVPLVRGEASPGSVTWDPDIGVLDPQPLEGADVLIHLAGESIASGRWTETKKARIRDSRVKGTELLQKTLGAMSSPPPLWISGSAIGIYGDRDEEPLTVESSKGRGFLADVCEEWEAAALPAADKGIRVVLLRTGVVLDPSGGALGMMLTPFKMGAGGRIGSGKQFMSWITREDMVRAILFLIDHPEINGPVNMVAPNPVTNAEFTRTLGKALHRPTFMPMPKFAARLAFGEMADECLLASQRVLPDKLICAGYPFLHPNLEGALAAMLRQPH